MMVSTVPHGLSLLELTVSIVIFVTDNVGQQGGPTADISQNYGMDCELAVLAFGSVGNPDTWDKK